LRAQARQLPLAGSTLHGKRKKVKGEPEDEGQFLEETRELDHTQGLEEAQPSQRRRLRPFGFEI
jgi:hypothetical protein